MLTWMPPFTRLKLTLARAGSMREEAPVPGIPAQLDHLDLVGHVALFAKSVPFGQPAVDRHLFPQPDHDHVPGFVGTVAQLSLDFFQVQRRDGMAEGHDLGELLAQRAIEETIGLDAGHPHLLDREVEGFVVLDLQIVIVDPVDRESELGGLGGSSPARHSRQW